MTRRTAALVVSIVALLSLVGLASVLPVPYVRIAPGTPYNTLGAVDGIEIILISGTTTYPTSGNLDLTTVSESGGPYGTLTMGDALRGLRDPAVRILPVEQVFPEPVDQSVVREENAQAFDESQSAAVSAAMSYLDRPVVSQVTAASVTVGGPSDGIIAPGDEVVSVEGMPVKDSADVGRAVRSKPVGTALTLVLRSAQAEGGAAADRTVTVTSAPRPDRPEVPYIGITVATEYRASFPITFGLKDVGGPSAGLMFALGIVDKLTAGEINGGRHVAGTGTIDPSGAVGPIGGIAQKVVGARDAGAELFLAPVENCSDLVGAVPEGLTVTPVTSLSEAVKATEAWVAGRAVPACPAT